MYHYRDEKVFFTQSKDEKTVYLFIPSDLNPGKISWTVNLPKKGAKLIFVPTGEIIPYKIIDQEAELSLSKKWIQANRTNPVWVFKFEQASE
jgi:alpha-L-fucosidase